MKIKLIYLAILVVSVLLAGRYLLMPGYFWMHDDIQVLRQYEMNRCFQDGQFPCRWSPDFGAGYGLPMFNYYSPLPNYIGMVPVVLGVDYVTTSKIVFLLSLLVSAFGMYFLVKLFTKNNLAALTAAISYTWAPYHLLDVFVRGALAESWGMAWIPWLIFLTIKISRHNRPLYNVAYTIILAAMFLSHNVLSLWTIPPIVILGFFLSQKESRSVSSFIRLILLNAAGFGLACFFIFPTLFEKNLITSQTLTQDYYDYRLHFVGIKQLFIAQEWGYGPSVPGPDDGLSFHLGYPQLLGFVIAIVAAIYALIKRNYRASILPLSLALITMIILWLMHSKSYQIWEMVPIITWTQFPWRLLSLTAFTMSLLVGISLPSIKHYKYICIIIIIFNIAAHWNYAVPKDYNSRTSDSDKLTGAEFSRQQYGAIRDYQPTSVPLQEIPLSNSLPQVVVTGDTTGYAENFIYQSNHFSLDAYVNGEGATVIIPIFAFPMWEVAVNGVKTGYEIDPDLGKIQINVAQGKSIITGWLKQTYYQNIGNTISLISLAAILIYLSKAKKNK